MNSQPEAKRIRDLCERARSEHVERHSPTFVSGPTRLTKDQNAEIRSLYIGGARPADIARQLGTTVWTVHHRLNRMGVKRRPIGMTEAEVQEAMRLNNAGTPITELTKRFGRSWKTIAKELTNARSGVSMFVTHRDLHERLGIQPRVNLTERRHWIPRRLELILVAALQTFMFGIHYNTRHTGVRAVLHSAHG